MYSVKFFGGGDTEIGKILAEAMAESLDPTSAKKMRSNIGLDAFNNMIRRSMGKTGSHLFKLIRRAFSTENPYGLDQLAFYTPTGQPISWTMENKPPKGKYDYHRGRRGKGKYLAPGSGFSGLMQYRITPESARGAKNPQPADNMTVGIIPERRGGNKWAARFAEWQTAGRVIPSYDRAGPGSERGYWGALGMPMKAMTQPKRPERQVISQVESQEKPVELFKRNFLERLMK